MDINFTGQVLTKPQVKRCSDLSFKRTASLQAKQIASDYFSSCLLQTCENLSKKNSKIAEELSNKLPDIIKKMVS